MSEWSNWSGSLRFTPRCIVKPEHADDLKQILREHFLTGRKIKLAAAGHSSTPLVETPETLLQLHRFKGLINVDRTRGTATFRAGTTVHEANGALKQERLALFNTGDVDVQTLAGAISTGTHGTGKKLQILSSMLYSVRLLDYQGEEKLIDEEHDPQLMKAIRVSLGSLGIFTEITVKTVPLFKLRRLELCVDVEACMMHFDNLADEHRNVDFYWYPRSDETKIRILTAPEKDMNSLPFKYKCKEDEVGWAGDVLPKHRELKFDEMEYAIPQESAMECFRQIRKRMKERHRENVAWRVLFRTIAADDNYLSPHYQRASVSISIHHNAGLPFKEFFTDIEPIFRQHNGRPHWAKQHSLKAAALKALYPEWDRFQECRRRLDPKGFFLNKYLKELFE